MELKITISINDPIEVKETIINMNLKVFEKQQILEEDSLEKKALMCLKQLDVEFQKLSLKNDIQSKVRTDLDQQQREYFLHQQMKTIQEELGGVSYDEEVKDE